MQCSIFAPFLCCPGSSSPLVLAHVGLGQDKPKQTRIPTVPRYLTNASSQQKQYARAQSYTRIDCDHAKKCNNSFRKNVAKKKKKWPADLISLPLFCWWEVVSFKTLQPSFPRCVLLHLRAPPRYPFSPLPVPVTSCSCHSQTGPALLLPLLVKKQTQRNN